jgi:hypothetical protein
MIITDLLLGIVFLQDFLWDLPHRLLVITDNPALTILRTTTNGHHSLTVLRKRVCVLSRPTAAVLPTAKHS